MVLARAAARGYVVALGPGRWCMCVAVGLAHPYLLQHWRSNMLHGLVSNGVSTIFPQAIGMAATFSPDLIHAAGRVYVPAVFLAVPLS